MQLNLAGRVALVTGAAQGIGRACAVALREAGAAVHLTDHVSVRLAAAGLELGLETTALDLSDRSATRALVDGVAARHGRPDTVAGAAGGVRGQVGRPIEEIEPEDWRAVFQANVDGAFWLAQAAAPVMKRGGWGRIVHIASGAGLRPSLTGIQAYAAAKHALVGLTKQLSWELAPSGVTVNAVAPGFVLSNPTTVRQWESFGADGQKRMVDAIHTRRLGRPEDIAAAAVNAGVKSGHAAV